jgi:hypothetical protein
MKYTLVEESGNRWKVIIGKKVRYSKPTETLNRLEDDATKPNPKKSAEEQPQKENSIFGMLRWF